MLFEFDSLEDQKAKIKVIGVGGAGGNAINRMISSGLSGVEFVAINTDAQDLENNNASTKIQIGKNLTKGLGAGAKSDIGRNAMEDEKDSVANIIEDADMIFVTAGMGGGTGTGAAPIIAQISRELGALTVGIVTKPFNFEGPKRMNRANSGLEEMQKNCDTIIVIPNQKLINIADKNTTLVESFQMADNVLNQATRGISDLINVHGIVNLDFADVDTIMRNKGDAIMGTGVASGDERAVLAAQQAISSPLLDDINMQGAQGVLVNITGGDNLTLMETNEACEIIFEEAGKDANVIFGAVIDPNMGDEMNVTVIATGFNSKTISKNNDILKHENSIPTFKKDADTINDKNNIPAFAKKNVDGNNDSNELKSDLNEKRIYDSTEDDLESPAYFRMQN